MSGPPGHSSARGAPALIPAHTASAISMARAAFAGPVRHVYVHVPFCRARCDYCDFASTAVGDAPDGRMLDAYVEGVAAEWELEAMALATRATGHHIAAGSGLGRLHTLYFGGGTPSLLGPDRLERLLELFRPHLTAHAEVTVECNPEDVDDALATWAADAPVARGAGAARGLRISLGVQSLAPRLREALGRRAQGDPADASRRLRSAGVANLSVDLIQGIPGQTMAGLEADIGAALDLAPDHISWYELTLVPGTPLARRLADHESGAEGEGQLVHDTGGAIGTASAEVSGTAADAAADARADLFQRIVRSLSRAGYDWYEVSNFALPGRRARHNVAYWRARPYLGLGPGAVTTVGARRWRNRPDPAAWAAALAAGRRPPREEERLAAATRQRERLMLAARCGLAVPVSELGGSLDADAARRLAAAGLVSLHSGTIRVTRKGRYVANEVCVRLFRDTYLRG